MLRALINPNNKWDIFFIVLGIMLICMAIFTSCDCNYHLERAKKKCGTSVMTQTVTVHDTTYINKVEKDTIFNYFQKDTVIIREGRLTMKYFYNNHDSTVYLSGTCDTIKIVKEIPVVVEKTVISYDWFARFKWWIIGGVVLLFLAWYLKQK